MNMVVFTNVKKEDVEHLGDKEETKTIYEVLRMKYKGVMMILYTSGKLLLQGKKDKVEYVANLLRKGGIGKEMKSESFRKEIGWMIGSDETLKGDTFGGLVVAAVKADAKIREKLVELGVADSKKLSDSEILVMANKIKRIAGCEIKSILPTEYNRRKKVTLILNEMHKECADYLAPGTHVVDLFPGCKVGNIKETKAESKYIEVAAASVLARAAGLEQLNYLSREAKFDVPKGSTHVKEGLEKLREKGLEFNKFVKLGFNNVREFLNLH
jgi:ribonuclease HIII